MKRFLRNAAYISIFAIIFAFAGCNDFSSDDDSVVEPVASTTKNKNDGKAYLSVSVNGSIARMISPTDITQAEITRAELLSKASDAESSSLVKNWQSDESKNAFEKMTSDTEILIDAGTYDFTLNLYAGDVFCQTGTLSSVEISAGNNPLSFSTKYVENGRGNFSVTLTWTQSERVSSVKAGLFTIASLGEERARGYEFSEIAVTAGEENNYAATYAKDEVTNGAYIIRFELYSDDGTKLNTLEDVIQIATACSTQKTIPLSNVNTIYTISYEKNGGDWAEDFTPTEKHNANTAVILPEEEHIAKQGYEFAGWYTSENGGETLSENALLAISAGTASDVTLYAKWTPAIVKYTVKHLLQNADDDNYTEAADDRETLYGKTESETAAVAKEYEHFTAKDIVQTAILPDGSTIVEIKYDREVFTVTYFNGGTEIASQSVKYGEKASELDAPTDSLRNFAGWYSSTDNGTSLSDTPFNFADGIVENVALYAIWGVVADASNVAEKIASMTKSDTVIVKGSISNDTLTAIRDAINKKNFGIKIDLSEATGLTSIGTNAFKNCTRLTSITIPSSVTSISSSAFYGCSGLTEMTIPFVGASADATGSNALFGYIFGASSYTGDTATKMYYSPGSYTTYYIPSALRTVKVTGGELKYGAFYNCSGLTSVTIGDGVTSIGERAFYGCEGLTSVTIGDGVTSIGMYAFYECSRLTSVTIPDSVTSIGSNAFSGCSGLTSVAIGDGVTSIGDFAFSECSGLTSVTIGDGVRSIGVGAFNGCSGLTSVTIPSSVTSIGDSAFYYCSGLTSVTIPSSVTSIGDSAFLGCRGLKSITIPDSVTRIGFEAFYGCSGLTSVTIGDGVTSIGGSAFRNCSGLESVVIPDSVTSIGEEAFLYCSGLESITFGGTVVQWNAISKGNNWKYNVPATKVVCSDGEVEL